MIRVKIEIPGNEEFDQFVIADSFPDNEQMQDYFMGRIRDSIMAAAGENTSLEKCPECGMTMIGIENGLIRHIDPTAADCEIDPRATFDEQDCVLPGYEDHTHCEIHGECIPVGSDCPTCLQSELDSQMEDMYWEQEAEDFVSKCSIHGTPLRSGEDCPTCMDEESIKSNILDGEYEQNIREHMENNPVSEHHPDCQCARCVYGDEAYLAHFHGSEY
jgi:hypothetical protein